MNFCNMNGIIDEIIKKANNEFTLATMDIGNFAHMKYPKLLPIMKFAVNQYTAEDFGGVMTMYTKAMGGMMELATIVFTPSTGKDAPFLLIDLMSMKKKRTVFIEYYDRTATGAKNISELEAVAEKYFDVSAYDEKPAWYVGERTSYSLIKGGTPADDEKLLDMISDSVDAYLRLCKNAEVNSDNLVGLKEFQSRMINEGNPSSDVLCKLLGKDGATDFFKNVIMPV